ncbi:MATE family efflux transporter [Roseburia hominis]|uniref:Probable multidrug resistance protein NorM n=1 Tax=Roseburia hominis TaxID=301301 RepID=A0A395V779_9FIRM|nr:MATE family efflux transporter [Roseburia hominis]RGS40979.1 MATE family efflux transporter [Roseburia hominis]
MRQTVKENRLFSKKDLRKLIIPLILEQTLAITVGMADTMMISSAGEAAVSGVSLVDMFNNLIISVLAALATGGAVVTSQCIGAGRREEACRSARQLVFTEAAITIGISVLVLLFHRQILGLFFGQIEADVMQNAIIYLIISVFSFPLLAVYDSCAALYRSMGNAQITLKISLLMNVINVVGNAIGVYVLKLGVAGVAIPSLVSRGVAGVVLFTLLHNPDNLVFLTRGKFKVDATIVKRIFFIGIPSGIENGIFQLGRVLVVSIIAAFGTSQIAANGVANSLDSMGCIVGQAMSLAMITVIGRCVGAGEEGQVRYYTKKLLGETYFYTAVINSIILLLLPWILQIYGLGEETTRLSYILVMIHDGMAIFLWPASFVLPNMLRACNDVKYTMVVSIFSMITFRIGFSYLFGVHMGWMAVGVWAAMVIDWVFRVICFVGRYLAGTWRKKCGLVVPTA